MTFDAKKLWEEVKENSRRLDGCVGPHDFSTDVSPPRNLHWKKWECTRCGGTCDSMAKHWYERGLSDGRI